MRGGPPCARWWGFHRPYAQKNQGANVGVQRPDLPTGSGAAMSQPAHTTRAVRANSQFVRSFIDTGLMQLPDRQRRRGVSASCRADLGWDALAFLDWAGRGRAASLSRANVCKVDPASSGGERFACHRRDARAEASARAIVASRASDYLSA